MKRNRRVRKHSRVTLGSMGAVSLIMTSLIALMAYWSVDARCASVKTKIGVAEKNLAHLESELTREKVKWDALKTPEQLEGALVRFGLAMDYVRESQLVRMSVAGVPEYGQISLSRRALVKHEGVKAPPVAAVEKPIHKGRSTRNARRR